MHTDTTDKKEIKLFNRLSSNWWNENGEMSILHSMSEARMNYIRNILIKYFSIKSNSLKVLKGLKILDVGCGGGISSEPFARMGAKVTGIDLSSELIRVAKQHSRKMNLNIEYLHRNIKTIVDENKKYDVVVALELLEHVNNLSNFCELLGRCVHSKGLIILSTINKTALSHLLVIKLAEDVFNKLPRGTHNFKKFIKPEGLSKIFKRSGFEIKNLKGISWFPLNRWVLTNNTSVNYICSFVRF